MSCLSFAVYTYIIHLPYRLVNPSAWLAFTAFSRVSLWDYYGCCFCPIVSWVVSPDRSCHSLFADTTPNILYDCVSVFYLSVIIACICLFCSSSSSLCIICFIPLLSELIVTMNSLFLLYSFIPDLLLCYNLVLGYPAPSIMSEWRPLIGCSRVICNVVYWIAYWSWKVLFSCGCCSIVLYHPIMNTWYTGSTTSKNLTIK